MCGRFTLRVPLTVLAQQFDFAVEPTKPAIGPRFNIAPTQDLPAVRIQEAGGPRRLTMLHWGLIPTWAKDTKIASGTINARGDTVADKPAFRTAFKRRRCLILADGYYEWLRVGKSKQPYLYEVDGGKPFAFAGLWESWRGAKGSDGPALQSCTVITTEANELASKVHDRMPVILNEGDYALWLDPAIQDRGKLEPLLVPFDAGRMAARPVSTFVNNARNQGQECVKAID
jgi:putative SOS response-associated peptidase YedK